MSLKMLTAKCQPYFPGLNTFSHPQGKSNGMKSTIQTLGNSTLKVPQDLIHHVQLYHLNNDNIFSEIYHQEIFKTSYLTLQPALYLLMAQHWWWCNISRNNQNTEQIESLCSEDTLLPNEYPYYWFILYPKSEQDKVKVTNLKNLPKFQHFEFSQQCYTWHTLWSYLIRCVNMKWIWWVLLKI